MDINVKPIDEHILRATKEIVVKFIEVGRISPANIQENFLNIYQTIETAVKKTPDVRSQQSPSED